MLYPSRTCCFAGYRPEKIKGWNLPDGSPPQHILSLLDKAILNAYENGYTTFMSGMSKGFDMWAAQKIIELKKEYPINLYCAIPFKAQSRGWESHFKNQYDKILSLADFTYCLSNEYSKGCYHVRNRFMIDSSSRLICWFNGTSGGTQFTYNYAIRQGIYIDNIFENNNIF